jgi:hypothetical protein
VSVSPSGTPSGKSNSATIGLALRFIALIIFRRTASAGGLETKASTWLKPMVALFLGYVSPVNRDENVWFARTLDEAGRLACLHCVSLR